MISGWLDGFRPTVSVQFLLAGKPAISVEFVIDTGFEGALTLPSAAIAAMELPFFERVDTKLANDAPDRVDSHVATVLWDEQEVDVLVLATGSRPLLGTSLLRGKELLIQFADSGLVTICDF